MLVDLITLPLRIGVFAGRLGVRVFGHAVILGLRAPERLVEAAVAWRAEPAGDEASGSVRVDVVVAPKPPISETPSTPAAPPERATEVTAGSAPTVEAPSPPPEPVAPTAGTARETTPAHVSRDAELVESFADPGAERGVGAAVDVEEPWEGYAHMTANDVIARLADASPEALAAVELYEHAHRGRKTVLAAADRQLRRATASAGGPT
jgi:hypothetical protein